MGLLLGEDFNRLFTSFDHTTRRLETRESYHVAAERPYIARYLAGMQEDPQHLARYRGPWLDTVRANVATGRRYQRIRVVPEPLSDYLRYALRGTRQTVEAGEDIRYLPRARANQLNLPDHDYWLFDDTRLALLHFTADDRPLGALVITEPEVVEQYRTWLDLAAEHATPYAEFLAQDPSREHPQRRPTPND
jgi:hypothetical protein